MTDATPGLSALEERVQRAKRQVPPPRHPRPVATSPEPNTTATEPAPTVSPAEEGSSSVRPRRRGTPASAERHGGAETTSPRLRSADELLKMAADAPTVMLGARVRAPFDDLLADAVHAARQFQVRTSKVELVELALLSIAGAEPGTLAERLRQFRAETNRYVPGRH